MIKAMNRVSNLEQQCSKYSTNSLYQDILQQLITLIVLCFYEQCIILFAVLLRVKLETVLGEHGGIITSALEKFGNCKSQTLS